MALATAMKDDENNQRHERHRQEVDAVNTKTDALAMAAGHVFSVGACRRQPWLDANGGSH